MMSATMIYRYSTLLFRAATLLVMFLPVAVCAQGEEDKFEIKDCRGRPAGICLKGECACEEWQIKVFRKDGKEWGLITGKTLASVQRQLKRNQDFDVQYARFFHIAVDEPLLNYQRPGKPVCRASCETSSAKRSPNHQNRKDRITEFADELQDMMLKEIGRVTKVFARVERKGANPFKGVGLVARDYANTLRDVFKRQKELRAKLTAVTDTMASTMADIDLVYRDLQTAESNARQARERLLDNVRLLLETGEMPTAGGAWNDQRVRDFDNSITQQTVVLNQNRITVSLKSTSDSINKVTYSLDASDIAPESIAVQSTDAADRWMVTFNTNGRRITKQTERETGPLTDNVSKMALFFSTEEAARTAAEAFRLLP